VPLLWVVVAGGIGSGARYLVGVWAIDRFGAGFPYGTIIINLAGCFALGFVAHLGSASAWNPEVRVAITVGLLGGFTTYSTFNHETLQLLMSGSAGAALANVALTVVGGLLAGWLGLVVARQLVA
jgi:CrcB protein